MTDKQIIKVDSLDELYITQLQAQLKAKEQECEEFKEKLRTKARGWANVNDQILKELAKIKENYKQTLIEIKSILELYANSKVGEEQPNGTYKIVVEAIGALGGACIAYYDPRPAKQGLQKISEYEVEYDNKNIL